MVVVIMDSRLWWAMGVVVAAVEGFFFNGV